MTKEDCIAEIHKFSINSDSEEGCVDSEAGYVTSSDFSEDTKDQEETPNTRKVKDNLKTKMTHTS